MPDRRLLTAVGASAVAFLVPLAIALGERDDVAFRFATGQAGAPLPLAPGQTLCQRGIDVPVAFDGVRVPGQRTGVEVAVRGDRGAGGRVDVCLRATRPVRLRAVPPSVAPESLSELDGEPAYADARLEFVRTGPATLAGRLDEIRDRATLFKPWWVAPGVVALLGLVIVAGVPLLLGAAAYRSR